MAGIQDIVQGGIGTGIQPKDNPNPIPGGLTPANQLASNSLPSGPLPPMQGGGMGAAPNPFAASPQEPPPTPPQPVPMPGSEDESQIANDLLSKLDSFSPKEEKKVSDSDLLDSLLDKAQGMTDPNAPISDPKSRHESDVDFKLRSMSDEGKFIWTQMRSRLGTSEEGQKAAVESAYGPGNVKMQGKDLYFRPNPDSKFRKFDQEMFGKWTDWALFNSLKAIPLAANIATQGAVIGGAVAGAPATGSASLLGLAGAGAAGGAAEVGTRRWLQAVTSAFGDKPVAEGNLMGDAMTVGGNAVLGPVGGIAVKGVRNLGSALMGLAEKSGALKLGKEAIVEAGERAAGDVATRLVRAREGLKSAISSFYPQAGDLDSSEGFGKALQPVFKQAEERLGQTIGSIKKEVIALADSAQDQAKKVVPMDKSMKVLAKELSDYGYAIGKTGQMELDEPVKLVRLEGKVKSALDLLKDQYNVLLNAKKGTGGVLPEEAFTFADELADRAGFAKASPEFSNEAKRLYYKAWQSHVDDRNSFVDSTLKGTGSQFENTWAKEYSKFHDQIDAVRDMTGLLKDDASKENFLKTIMSGSTTSRNNFLEATKTILEERSPETWKGLQGQLVNRMLDTATDNGVVKADKVLKFMNAKDNAPLMNLLFEGKDANVFKKALLEASAIDAKGILSDSDKEAVKGLAKGLLHVAGDPAQAVLNFFKATSNSATQAKYLMSEGFADLINKAETPAIKNNFMQARRLMEDVTDKMKILDVPTVYGSGVKKTVKRYAPIIGAVGTETRAYSRPETPVQ